MVQRTLAGRYELLEMVGGGGMADVYKAQDKLLDRPVAVKILHSQLRGDSEFIAKFTKEARAAARISNPNIVNIYDVGEESGEHYIVMEYVPGVTLKDYIKTHGHFSVADSLKIAGEIANALLAAHNHNLVHCDIKPHNILLTPDGHIKVADFGIARAVTETTMTYNGNVVGSVHYFSPEQAKGVSITPKSDVYSLGVVLYEMLTGQLPFNGETPVSIAMKHLQDEPPLPRSINPNIPPVVEAVVLKAMSKDPSIRPDSLEFANDLRQAELMLSNGHGYKADVPKVTDPYATQVMPRVNTNSVERSMPARPASRKPEPPVEKPFYKKTKFYVVMGLLLVLGFCIGAFASYGNIFGGKDVDVPDVVGKDVAIAQQLLEGKKLKVKIQEGNDAKLEPGKVISQTPDAGTKVKEGRQVTIVVNRSGGEVSMPDLNGFTKNDAIKLLEKMGLKAGSVYEKASKEEAGTVIDQQVKPGTKVKKGKSVDFTVSRGEGKKKVNVPDLTGLRYDDAEAALNKVGLDVGNVSKVESSKASEGSVVSSSPKAGTSVDAGSSVSLVIAEGASKAAKVEKAAGTAVDTAKKVMDNIDTIKEKLPTKGNDDGKTR